jgi:transketolase
MKPLRQVFGETLTRLGAEVENLVVLDADLSKSTKTSLFAAAYPARFHDMGIAEQDMLSTAAGLAASGMLPVASTFAIFGSGRAWEQLRNAVCYPSLNVKLVVTHGGITVGQDGGSHQAVEDLAVTRVIPNLRVFVPADGPATAQIIEAVVKEIDGPCYVRLPRGGSPPVTPKNARFSLGKAALLRAGDDLTFCACGLMVAMALEAAETLAKEGIEARVLDMASLKPIDEQALIAAARETGAIVTLEEHSVIGGLGAAVCEVVCAHAPCPVLRLGINDRFGQSGSAEQLLQRYGLTAENAISLAKDALTLKA